MPNALTNVNKFTLIIKSYHSRFTCIFNEIAILSQEEQQLPSVHKETQGHTDQLYAECLIVLKWLLSVDRLCIQALVDLKNIIKTEESFTA